MLMLDRLITELAELGATFITAEGACDLYRERH